MHQHNGGDGTAGDVPASEHTNTRAPEHNCSRAPGKRRVRAMRAAIGVYVMGMPP